MKRHVKIYMKFFGYCKDDVIPCEICNGVSVDVHHIDARGMGGRPDHSADKIENLIALCRDHHDTYGDVKDMKPYLRMIHQATIDAKQEGVF